MFYGEFCKIFKNTFFTEHLRTTEFYETKPPAESFENLLYSSALFTIGSTCCVSIRISILLCHENNSPQTHTTSISSVK